LKFFLDVCLSPHFAEFLKGYQIDVVHPWVDRDLDPHAKDPVWIPKICKQGRIVLTSDKAQTKTKGKTIVELSLMQRYRGRGFYFENGFPGWPIWKQTACFFRAWEKIYTDYAPKMMLGELYGISADAKITQKHLQKVN
jgi:hypothetical protein